MKRKLPEPYSKEARAEADRAGCIMLTIRGGEWLGAGISTKNGGQYVNEISWAVRGSNGEVYHLCLTDREMDRLGFIREPRLDAESK